MQFSRALKTPAGQTSADTYADMLFYDVGSGEAPGTTVAIVQISSGGPLSFHVWNTHGVNSIDFKVLGSNDRTLADALWVDQSLSLTAVTAGIGKTATVAQPGLKYYKLQVKASVGGSQGTANAAIAQNGLT